MYVQLKYVPETSQPDSQLITINTNKQPGVYKLFLSRQTTERWQLSLPMTEKFLTLTSPSPKTTAS